MRGLLKGRQSIPLNFSFLCHKQKVRVRKDHGKKFRSMLAASFNAVFEISKPPLVNRFEFTLSRLQEKLFVLVLQRGGGRGEFRTSAIQVVCSQPGLFFEAKTLQMGANST